MKSDIEISRETRLVHINTVAGKIGLDENELIHYGKYKAKIPLSCLRPDKIAQSNLILVTAITPNKAGVGKTVTSISLALGLCEIGQNAAVALREPSLGPVFGMKGGAAGGGYAQVLPMEDINLHFTGDFHAITAANNLIAALLDNYQYNNLHTDKALKQLTWRRVMDMNDRSLRHIVSGLGGRTNGIPTEAGFDITPASEIMAILCLSENLEDFRNRVDRIVLGYKQDNSPFTVKDLGCAGAVLAVMKDALLPNLVQTTENTPAFIHGGPFANIAHGCNSVLATKMAMSYADYVVTEAGFGSDLGAEKFLNIKCRTAGLQPKAVVIVVTSQALKLHGNVPEADIKLPNMTGIKTGLLNLERHIENLRSLGQSVVVAFNHFHFDAPEEVDYLRQWCLDKGVHFALNQAFAKGGKGATELARTIVEVIEKQPSAPIQYTYELTDSVENKIRHIAQKIYRADDVEFDGKAKTAMAKIRKNGWDHFPVCIAKTQYSFTDNPKLSGAPSGFVLHVQDLVITTGAGFIVAVAGDIMRMPGLPKDPQANHIDVVDGLIEGLS